MNNTLTRLDRTYRMNELPKLKTNAFIWQDRTGHTGSLIKRTVKNSFGVYKHFGFIYGFDETDTLWIIENNSNGVECITYRGFLDGNQFAPIIEHNFNQDNCEEILNRAFEKGFDRYNPRDNNCEHFINYCLFGESTSIQVDNTEMIASAIISAFEIRVCLSTELRDLKILDTINQTRQTIRLKRPPEMEKIIDERRKVLKSLNKKKSNKAKSA